MLVNKIPVLFGKEMQESGFAAARWASAWSCHLPDVKAGSRPFWVKWQKWSLWKSFWRYDMGYSKLAVDQVLLCMDIRTAHKQKDWDVAGTLCPEWVWRGIPLYQNMFSPSLPFTQGTHTHKCMPGVIQLPKVEDVRFSRVSRTRRCFKSKCYLNRNNEVFERVCWSVPFEWEKLSFSLLRAFSSSEHLQLKPLPVSYLEKKAGDVSVWQTWV